MQKKILLALACFSLAACGSASKVAEKKKGPTPAPPAGQKDCPASPPTNMHRIVLNFASNMPANMGLKLEGDADFRLSNCAQTSQRGVEASWQRDTNRKLIITVDHKTFYNNELPSQPLNLEIFDLQNCGASATSFFKTTAPLVVLWHTEAISPTCSYKRVVGEATFHGFTEAGTEEDLERVSDSE